MNINELMVKEEGVLTFRQKFFLKVHTSIMTSGAVISNALLDLAKNLREMKEEELYLEVGFKTFDDYCEQVCGLKSRQAYNYIKVFDDLGEEFLHSNAKIGISKLTLLTTLSEGEKIEIFDNVDIEGISVKKLKQEIEDLKKRNKVQEDVVYEKDKLKQEVVILKAKINELKNQNPKIVEVEKDNSENFKKKLLDLEYKLRITKDQLKDKEKNLDEQLRSKDLEIEKLKTSYNILSKQVQINSSEELVEFKMKFDDLQKIVISLKNLILRLPEDKQEGCKNALKKVVEVLC
ncbi:MAG: hypothetical protein IJ008_03515 [Clostridia bacterium]|nr:hypothetical protein [Clostridia bacterium]